MASRQHGRVTLEGTPYYEQSITRSQPRPYEQHGSTQPVDNADTPPPPPVHRSVVPHLGNSITQAPTSYDIDSSSDISDYHPPDSGLRALQDVDNLYRPAGIPSPKRSKAYDDRPASIPTRPTAQQHRYSEQSLAPLITYPASPVVQPPSPVKAPFRKTAPSARPQQHYHQGDGYDDVNPDLISSYGIDEPPGRSRSRMGLCATTAFLHPRGASKQYEPISSTNQRTQMSEKDSWVEEQHATRRRRRILWIIGTLVLLAVIAAAVVGGVLASSKTSSTSTAHSSTGALYDVNSNEVQQVLNNNALHRVFPAMDYTPLHAQYPDCLTNPPDQNNITLDVAMLSQLTPAIRLYGTDCKQTEMVLAAIDRLKMNSTMSIWLGVWLGTNTTTNDRQLAQMYDILNKYPASQFAGVIVGNEVLFRKDMTLTRLGSVLTEVRSNLTAKGISLPVATSDLGDNWTTGLAATTDIVMANVHPFFAGVTPDIAPGWTYNFWQQHDANLATAKAGSWPKSIISEVGWPSEGGNDCGTTSKTCSSGQGAVATVDNMNTFMNGFVCQSLTNGTTYFWFEAFDEPWKVIYETDIDQWESKWGLFDSNRNLKAGIKIPGCGGKTLSKPY